MTWRGVGALEWRRTGGPFVAVALALTGVVLFASKQRPFNSWSTWSSTVADALQFVSSSGIVLGPLVAAVAAWVAGRERRRRMGDLLACTARPSWQRRLATSGAVSAVLLLAWLVQTAVVVGGVFPSVSYWGGRWWATLLLMGLGVLLCAAAGSAFGRWVPGRLVPPALGMVIYVLTAIPVYLDASWIQLVPVGNPGVFGGEQLEARVIPWAVIWTTSLVVLVGVAAVGRRRHWRVAAAAAGVAVVCAVSLQVAPHLGREGAPGVEPVQRSWVEADPAAVVPVCTDDTPVVCVQRVHAGFLRDVAPVAREQLQVVGRYLPVDRAEELDWGVTGAADVFPLIPLTGMGQPYRSGADPDALQQWSDINLSTLTAFYCPEMEKTSPAWADTVSDTAARLIGQQAFAQDERGAVLAARLEADPAQARAWMASFRTASRTCDVPELERLAAS